MAGVYFFFAVLAERLKFAAVGAPLDPALRIFSPLPAAIRLRFAWMLAYNPGLAIGFFRFLFSKR